MSMRDTDWRPTRCPECDDMRSGAEAPVCENPYCDLNREKGKGWGSPSTEWWPLHARKSRISKEELDAERPYEATWPPKSTERRIGKPQPVVFYVLRAIAGESVGRGLRPNGFMVQDKKLADEWKKKGGVGVDYLTYEGVMVQRLEDIPGAKDIIARQKALNKLTAEEKALLGLG